MDIGAQVAARGELEQFTDIDDEGAGNGGGCDPAILALDLEAADLVLQQHRDEARVLVGADTLVAVLGTAARIADDLEQLVGGRRVDRREDVRPLAQRQGQRLGNADAEPGHFLLVAEQCGLQFGKRRGPEIGANEAGPGWGRAVQWARRLLGADVDLLSPVRAAAGVFQPGAVVAAELRRLDHLDLELVRLRQVEEAA